MSARAATWLAWSLWALYVTLAIPLVLLGAANDVSGTSADPISSFLQTLVYDAPLRQGVQSSSREVAE